MIRLEDGRVRLIRFAGESFVGELEEPTFDIWPPSGEATPEVRRPDVGLAAPPEVAARDAVPLCGEEQLGVTESRLERSCFMGAVRDGRPAEFVSRSVDVAGDPVVELYRYMGRGPVFVYRSLTPAGPGWVRNDCAIGSAFDDAAIFVVTECLPTELT